METRFIVKNSLYFDSIALMNIAKEIKQVTGLDEVALVMGTDANKQILGRLAALPEAVQQAKSTDLILLMMGSDLDSAQATAEKMLQAPRAKPNTGGESRPPKSLRSAAQQAAANLAMISVPGMYAAQEAWAGLQQGLHVFIFSDNVPLREEVALKQFAAKKNLLVMGPGAGTAIINGTALGFANVVPRGAVGIISAAGTGLQEVSTLLAKQGLGISQAIGVGGRDLSDAVGGCMTLAALDALQADPDTDQIIIISKLPAPRVAEKVLGALAACGKPTIVAFMTREAFDLPAGVRRANTLQEAAYLAAGKPHFLPEQSARLQAQAADLARKGSDANYLRGLFSGGTLCQESIRLWSAEVGEVWSNTPLNPAYQLPDVNVSVGHCAIDMGEEEFTLGRPHPMIDLSLRIERLRRESQNPEVALIQLDVVLGYSAHPDPAAELAPVIADILAARPDLLILMAITGTDDDPQNYSRQAQLFQDCGAVVLGSNAEAAQLAGYIARERTL